MSEPEAVSTRTRRTKRFLKWGCGLLLVCALVGVVHMAYVIHKIVTVHFPDGYGQVLVAEILIQYMEDHRGAWPRDWDDLQKSFEQRKGSYGFQSLDELCSRIDIDFTADPKQLAQATLVTEDEPPFRVIWLRSGERHHIGGEPNRIIWDFLHERGRQPSIYQHPKPAAPEERLPPH